MVLKGIYAGKPAMFQLWAGVRAVLREERA